MLFTPYQDEAKAITMIGRHSRAEYALVRLSNTMVDKSIIDANVLLRDALSAAGIIDFDEIENGERRFVLADFIQASGVEEVQMSFYRVNNSRGDRRFSISSMRQRANEGQMRVGDLIYFSTRPLENGHAKVFFVNLTENTPSESILSAVFGVDATDRLLASIMPTLSNVIGGRYYDNSKGRGAIAPKDVGDTLEHILGVSTNNRPGADLFGLIEIKAKQSAGTMDTLFSLRPRFDGTPVASFESNDRSRVSAFARYYGYYSDRHPGYKNLYITIGSKDAPQNHQGFYLDVVERDARVNLMHTSRSRAEIAAYWYFEDLRQSLYEKHPSTLWVKAAKRYVGDLAQFRYLEAEFTRTPRFATFITLIKSGEVTYDWRGYTTPSGPYSGKNHGNAWRIKSYARENLFDSTSII